MKLPAADRAVVEPAKVRDYLLSPEHSVGRSKARVFEHLGFTRAAWGALQLALRDLAVRGDAVERSATEYGRKYEVTGPIEGLNGRRAQFVTIWIILRDEDFPRLVTAYPGDAP